MNVNFEAIEKAWFKPKKDVIKVNLNLKGIKNLENYITDLEQSRYVLEKLEKYLEQEATNIIRTDGMYRVAYQEDLNILNKIQELKKEMK